LSIPSNTVLYTYYLKETRKEFVIESIQLRKLLSANIKKYRKILGISQERLAEISGLSIQTINGIEGCRTWVSDFTLVAISSALGVDVFQLLLPENIAEFQPIPQTVSTQFLLDTWMSVKTVIDAQFERLTEQYHEKRQP